MLMRTYAEDIVHMLDCAGWGAFLDEGELDEVSYYVSAYRGNRGDVLFSQGDDGSHAWLLAFGCVEVTARSQHGRIVRVDQLQTGETVGEQALLDGQLRSADARVLSDDAILLLLTREDFDRLSFRRPRLALDVVKSLAGQLSIRLRKATQSMTGLRSI
jgi:CRP/FNR family cyclic AMP-dependent transcriptional regulator